MYPLPLSLSPSRSFSPILLHMYPSPRPPFHLLTIPRPLPPLTPPPSLSLSISPFLWYLPPAPTPLPLLPLPFPLPLLLPSSPPSCSYSLPSSPLSASIRIPSPLPFLSLALSLLSAPLRPQANRWRIFFLLSTISSFYTPNVLFFLSVPCSFFLTFSFLMLILTFFSSSSPCSSFYSSSPLSPLSSLFPLLPLPLPLFPRFFPSSLTFSSLPPLPSCPPLPPFPLPPSSFSPPSTLPLSSPPFLLLPPFPPPPLHSLLLPSSIFSPPLLLFPPPLPSSSFFSLFLLFPSSFSSSPSPRVSGASRRTKKRGLQCKSSCFLLPETHTLMFVLHSGRASGHAPHSSFPLTSVSSIPPPSSLFSSGSSFLPYSLSRARASLSQLSSLNLLSPSLCPQARRVRTALCARATCGDTILLLALILVLLHSQPTSANFTLPSSLPSLHNMPSLFFAHKLLHTSPVLGKTIYLHLSSYSRPCPPPPLFLHLQGTHITCYPGPPISSAASPVHLSLPTSSFSFLSFSFIPVLSSCSGSSSRSGCVTLSLLSSFSPLPLAR
ncbi:hypothetical protein C7M84_020600 [Penaeus vannamei]|uniref:Uncharacterized protein n=1 Tax=Penaeus vannamei TaxID=6689 RepID=A0A3R7SHK8_PENVA|nr:hypothetical protein C7M84_020600 [Penaeus vannamei]